MLPNWAVLIKTRRLRRRWPDVSAGLCRQDGPPAACRATPEDATELQDYAHQTV